MAGAAPEEEKPTDDEPGDPDKISVTRKGEPIGPYSRDKAKEYFAAGQLLPTDWGWHEGMDEWKPLYEVLGMEVPTQTTVAAGKPGKGKKVALIAGGVGLLVALIGAGASYIPGMPGFGDIKESIGAAIMIVGMALCIFGFIWFFVQAFRVSIGWGIFCFFCTFGSLLFLISHWNAAHRPFLASLLGLGVAALGAVIADL